MLLNEDIVIRNKEVVKIKTDTELIRFIDYNDQQVLMIDFSGNTAEEMLADLKKVRNFLETQVEKKLCIVEDLTGVRFNRDVVVTAKEMWSLQGNKIYRIATVGIEGLKKIARDEVKEASGLEFRNFDSIKEALDYVVEGKSPEKAANCWEFMGCSDQKRLACPAFTQNGGHVCWLIAGTFCEGGKPQGRYLEKIGSCLNCQWYRWKIFKRSG